MRIRFVEWSGLLISLNIWHFMRMLAVGCITNVHTLNPTFLVVPALTDLLVNRRIRKELSQYFHRRMHSEKVNITLIEQLLQELGGGRANHRDLIGVPLLYQMYMEYI